MSKKKENTVGTLGRSLPKNEVIMQLDLSDLPKEDRLELLNKIKKLGKGVRVLDKNHNKL